HVRRGRLVQARRAGGLLRRAHALHAVLAEGLGRRAPLGGQRAAGQAGAPGLRLERVGLLRAGQRLDPREELARLGGGQVRGEPGGDRQAAIRGGISAGSRQPHHVAQLLEVPGVLLRGRRGRGGGGRGRRGRGGGSGARGDARGWRFIGARFRRVGPATS